MPLAGKGAIVIWNDVAPEGREQYYDWHNHEHMPERLGIPGFRRGNRYVAIATAGRPEFLTVYELADRGVATSEAYLARLNAPSDWSVRTMKHFRNMIRALTEVEISEGVGMGGVAASVRFEDNDQGRAALATLRARPALLRDLAALPRMTGAHLCVTDASASAAKTTESRNRGDSILAPIGVLLLEGCDTAAVQQALEHFAREQPVDATTATVGIYALEHSLLPAIAP